MQYSAIILAGGIGSRMDLGYNKIFHEINGKRVLDYSVEFFEKDPRCTDIVLVCNEQDFNFVYKEYLSRKFTIITGGINRQGSVYKGLNKAKKDIVLVHDSARPYINHASIDKLLHETLITGASTLAVFVKDTMVKVNGNRLSKTLDRSSIVAVQTPQGFKTDLLLDAHQKARATGYLATDDTDLVRKFTHVMPSFVIGDYRSIKLTTKEDIKFLEVIL
jgi:2-C-methyl-D-erythritol 4-phosphate cytidylyltransferase